MGVWRVCESSGTLVRSWVNSIPNFEFLITTLRTEMQGSLQIFWLEGIKSSKLSSAECMLGCMHA